MSDLHNTAVRLARLTDAAAITTIYNQGIEERNATFETEPRTVAQLTAQLTDKGERYPTVVVERDGQVVAWASAGLYRGRLCYGSANRAVTALGHLTRYARWRQRRMPRSGEIR